MAEVVQTATLSYSCCDKLIARAMKSGSLDVAENWNCPKCGCEWKPATVEGIRVWSPHEHIAVFR